EALHGEHAMGHRQLDERDGLAHAASLPSLPEASSTHSSSAYSSMRIWEPIRCAGNSPPRRPVDGLRRDTQPGGRLGDSQDVPERDERCHLSVVRLRTPTSAASTIGGGDSWPLAMRCMTSPMSRNSVSRSPSEAASSSTGQTAKTSRPTSSKPAGASASPSSLAESALSRSLRSPAAPPLPNRCPNASKAPYGEKGGASVNRRKNPCSSAPSHPLAAT